jgi:hypothetical protein
VKKPETTISLSSCCRIKADYRVSHAGRLKLGRIGQEKARQMSSIRNLYTQGGSFSIASAHLADDLDESWNKNLYS